MIGNRVIFVLIPLFLILVTTISTAPIIVNQFTNETMTTTELAFYEDDTKETIEKSDEQETESTTVEYKEDTTPIPEIVTSDLLFADATEETINLDEIIKTSTHVSPDNEGELPATPTTESPEPSQSITADHE
jgi:c-di-AMP phosphodiesterase-like protein